jgi:hypothetical protein
MKETSQDLEMDKDLVLKMLKRKWTPDIESLSEELSKDPDVVLEIIKTNRQKFNSNDYDPFIWDNKEIVIDT